MPCPTQPVHPRPDPPKRFPGPRLRAAHRHEVSIAASPAKDQTAPPQIGLYPFEKLQRSVLLDAGRGCAATTERLAWIKTRCDASSPHDVTPVDPVIQRVKSPCPAPLGTPHSRIWSGRTLSMGTLAVFGMPSHLPSHPGSIQARPLPSSAFCCTPSQVSGRYQGLEEVATCSAEFGADDRLGRLRPFNS
jgi:hypothetical protein